MSQYSLFHSQGDSLVEGLKCTACALSSNPKLQTNCMQGLGSVRPTFLFVGTAPGIEDDGLGYPRAGKYGRLFQELLDEAGYKLTETHFTNCLKCCLHEANPGIRHWRACKQHFVSELQSLNPKVIVAVGGQALSWLTGQTGVAKLARVALPLADDLDRCAYAIRQPSILFHCEGAERYEQRRSIINDLRWIRDQYYSGTAGRPVDKNVYYRRISEEEEVEQLFAELDRHDDISVDLETDGFVPEDGKEILCVGFSWARGVGRSLPVHAPGIVSMEYWQDGFVEREIYPRLKRFFETKRVFGQNFIQFDQKWLRSKLGVRQCNIDFDTMLAHYCLDEERGTHDLERLGLLYTNTQPWKKSFNPRDIVKLCEYNCKDVDVAYQVRQKIEQQLTPRQSWLLRQLLIPLAKELAEMESTGVAVNVPAIRQLESVLDGKLASAISTLRQHSDVRRFQLAENVTLNPDSPEQLRVLFAKYLGLKCIKKTDGGAYSTDAEVLSHYASHPVVAAISNIRGLSKLKGTYCSGIMERVRNGRIHTSYRAHATVTGRLASSDPNLQNIPRSDTVEAVLEDGQAIKRLFQASPGCVLIQADMSQAELRVLASVSGDRKLIQIYLDGEDAHTATAAYVYGIPLSEVTKAQRTYAKSVNFGIVYGMTEEGLIARFKEAGATDAEAINFLQMHRRTFSGVYAYMDQQEKLIFKQRFQETYFGRRRRYLDIDHRAVRQAYNFPIQSLASDITLLSLVRLAKALRILSLPAKPVLTVHDSIVLDCRSDQVDQVAKVMRDIMTGVTFEWMKVPMEVDLEVGPTWGEMEPLEITT